MLISNGIWDNRKMNNVGELTPRPWLQLLDGMGLKTRDRDLNGDRDLFDTSADVRKAA
ncbi:hypothetical protein LMG26686_00970 [Achromobacter mucicolens]|nr:hypothetical protein LMG26686_00970 [Achromobacter mucicolens]